MILPTCLPLSERLKFEPFKFELQAQPKQANITYDSANATDIGRVRHRNDDALLSLDNEQLWVIADGIGGLTRGDYASRTVIKSLMTFKIRSTIHASIDDIDQSLSGAHQQCLSAFSNKKIGATVALLFIQNGYAFFIWAGDSRIYRVRNKQVTLMTYDHTLLNKKIEQGLLTNENNTHHPDSHKLTRSIGAHTTLHLDMRICAIEAGDRFLICSDGLLKDVNMYDFEQALCLNNLHESTSQLIQLGVSAGGRDNMSAVLVEALTKTPNDP